MKHTTHGIGRLIRKTRKAQGLTQRDLALVCDSGERFIVDVEKGKPSCEFAKVLTVLQTLGIDVQLIPPFLEE